MKKTWLKLARRKGKVRLTVISTQGDDGTEIVLETAKQQFLSYL